MNILEKRGEYIRTKRKAMDLSQEQLGEMIGKTGKTISKWENGESETTHENYQKLAEIFSVHISEIMAGEDMDGMSDEKKQYFDQVIGELSERIEQEHQITSNVEERGLISAQLGFYAFGLAGIAFFLAWYAAFPSRFTFAIWIIMCVLGIAFMIFGKRWADKLEEKRQAESTHTKNK